MGNFIIRLVINALALLAVAYVVPGVHVVGFGAALIAAIVLGIVNAILKPILIILSLPIEILTLGLFTFVINALLFWLVAHFVPGFTVDGFLAAFLGALLLTVVSFLLSQLIRAAEQPEKH
ncbi:MAG: phage holin family protein [Vulcanimicrobiaceae bacterium]